TALSVATIGAVALSIGVMVLGSNLSLDVALNRETLARFWQQPELFICVWCGLGLAAVRLHPAFVTMTCATLALVQVGLNWRQMDEHHNRVVHDHGAALLTALPQNTLLITGGDLFTNTVPYLQRAEGMRPDVRWVDFALLSYSWECPRLTQAVCPGSRYAHV